MGRTARSSISPYPLTFGAAYQHRVWGGRRLARVFSRALPAGPIGESWELVDRPGVVSVVDQGPLKGATLGELWAERHDWFPVPGPERPARFPLLIKLLDCHEYLSVQVHPTEQSAAVVGGEPKAELWYFLDSARGAGVFAGFRHGATRTQLERALSRRPRDLVSLLHCLRPRPGDALLIPPGRIHALGPGNLLCEIQQNSDTTFRIYDWDRRDTGGSRPLHIPQAMASLNFHDWEPDVLPRDERTLLDGPWFRVVRRDVEDARVLGAPDRFIIGLVTRGRLVLDTVDVEAGRCFLLPAGHRVVAGAEGRPTRYLEVTLP